MSNIKKYRNLFRKFLTPLAIGSLFAAPCFAEDEVIAVDVFADNRPIFQQIADLEQERILLQLEKEKVQLLLDLDRMAAEQARLRNDMDRLSGQGAEDARQLELERARFEQERERLVAQNERLEEQVRQNREEQRAEAREAREPRESRAIAAQQEQATPERGITERFRLIEIVGAGRQLQATVEDLSNGQRRRVSVGRDLDGHEVKSISLDEGVVLVDEDGNVASLGIGVMRD